MRNRDFFMWPYGSPFFVRTTKNSRNILPQLLETITRVYIKMCYILHIDNIGNIYRPRFQTPIHLHTQSTNETIPYV
jgi:hypothetical protein